MLKLPRVTKKPKASPVYQIPHINNLSVFSAVYQIEYTSQFENEHFEDVPHKIFFDYFF